MKRSTPVDGFADGDISSKRQRVPIVIHHRFAYPQPGAKFASERPQDGAVYDDLLRRAISVALYSSGFDCVQQSAIEGFLALVESYMSHFCQRIAQSMQASRRAQPVPHDFVHALSQFGITSSSLDPHLQISIPFSVTQPPLFPPSKNTADVESEFAAGLDSSEEGAIRKPYIPKHFPNFPSQHAYKDTPTYTQRETDATKIREHATQEGILAEQALRKLMAASKAGARANRTRKGSADAYMQQTEDIWQETLAALAESDRNFNDSGVFGLDGVMELAKLPEDQLGAIVNYDRAYWRQGARDRVARKT